jgi:hypothetical protein
LATSGDPSLKAEERRALVLLGLLAVIVGLYGKLSANSFVNFPANSPFPHLTILVSPLLADLIGLWIGYGICMLVYFSDDLFPGNNLWTALRMFCHGLGWTFIGVLLIFGYFSVVAEVSFFLPASAQGVYWFFATGVEFLLIVIIAETSFRQRGLVRKAGEIWLSSISELGREVASSIAGAIEAVKERKRKKGEQPKKGNS